jgi:hypothetical protein
LIVTPDCAQSGLGNFCLRKARMRRAARDHLSSNPNTLNEIRCALSTRMRGEFRAQKSCLNSPRRPFQ